MNTRTARAVSISIIITVFFAFTGCTDVPKGFEKSLKLKDQAGEKLKSPFMITADSQDNIFVFDRFTNDKNVLYKFSHEGDVLAQWKEVSCGMNVYTFFFPASMKADIYGNLFIYDMGFYSVKKISARGECDEDFAGRFVGGERVKAAEGVTTDGEGNVYVVNYGNHIIHKFDQQGNLILKMGSRGNEEGKYQTLTGFTVDYSGRVYVLDEEASSIVTIAPTGDYMMTWPVKPYTHYIVADGSDNIYVAGTYHIIKYDRQGNVRAEWLSNEDKPVFQVAGIAVDSAGNLLVLDTAHSRILITK